GVAQPVDAVALHQTHGAGVVVWPHRLRAQAPLGFEELLGDEIERVVPGDRLIPPGAFRPGAAHRPKQPAGMMYALGVARHLRADHAGGVAVVGGAANPADGALVEDFDLERAGRRTIVRTGRMADPDGLRQRANGLIHGWSSIVERRGVVVGRVIAIVAM